MKSIVVAAILLRSILSTNADAGTAMMLGEPCGSSAERALSELDLTKAKCEKEADNVRGGDLGEMQEVSGDRTEEMLLKIREAREYVQGEVMTDDDKYAMIRHLCINKHQDCAYWSVVGECEANPGYMAVHCGPMCQSCHLLNVANRCPMDQNAADNDALKPGDINRMFERIATDPFFKQYEPIVLSRPTYAPGDTADTASYNIGIWLIMFENALSNEEADRMIEFGEIEGYERSEDMGDELPDGTYSSNVSPGRTSYNSVRALRSLMPTHLRTFVNVSHLIFLVYFRNPL